MMITLQIWGKIPGNVMYNVHVYQDGHAAYPSSFHHAYCSVNYKDNKWTQTGNYPDYESTERYNFIPHVVNKLITGGDAFHSELPKWLFTKPEMDLYIPKILNEVCYYGKLEFD